MDGRGLRSDGSRHLDLFLVIIDTLPEVTLNGGTENRDHSHDDIRHHVENRSDAGRSG
jgi:hypothetical protein